MTPETRAARERLRGLLGAKKGTAWPVIDEGVDADLRTVLAALDRYEAIEESVLETARQVAEHAARFGPVPDRVEVTYQVAARECEGCGCCNAAGCHRDPDSLCPTNSLGDSVCPCTEA